MTALEALARAIHADSPHGALHPFDECPQRKLDEDDAQRLIEYLAARRFGITELP